MVMMVLATIDLDWCGEDPPFEGCYLVTRRGAAFRVVRVCDRGQGQYRLEAVRLESEHDVPPGAEVAGLWDWEER